jgi:hypothetical protein
MHILFYAEGVLQMNIFSHESNDRSAMSNGEATFLPSHLMVEAEPDSGVWFEKIYIKNGSMSKTQPSYCYKLLSETFEIMWCKV